MPEPSNRALNSSVVYMGVADYTKRPVAEQMRLRDQVNAVVAEAIRDVPASDRIILDTSDGAALSFLGSPEDALFVAAAIRDATSRPAPGEVAPLPVRLGINFGPVRLVKDPGGQPNIIGDGINVAQRMMGFAEPGQIRVSRAYFEEVSRLGKDHARLFHYEGTRTDRQVRAHEIYALDSAPALDRLRATARVQGTPGSAAAPGASRREWVLLGVLVATILTAGTVLRFQRQLAEGRPAPAIAPAPAPQAAASAAPRPKLRSGESPSVPAAQRPEAEARPTRPLPRERKPEQTEPAAAAAGSMGQVTFAILPWGEVYVDGKLRGVSPPLRVLDLKSGRHVIEIRNTSFPVYTEVVDLRAADRIRVRHHFQ